MRSAATLPPPPVVAPLPEHPEAEPTEDGPWNPRRWRDRPALQQPDWPDSDALEAALVQLAAKPPLVFAGEARRLTAALAEVASGRAFLLQAGDCAESFSGFSAESIRDNLKVILQMAIVLTYGSGVPVVKIGRVAGQFAKPRSAATEKLGEAEIPSFRGDIVNHAAPHLAARVPDPSRMLEAYHQSAATLNLLRGFTTGGFASLSQLHAWNQEFVASSPQGRRYEALARDVDATALDLLRSEPFDLVLLDMFMPDLAGYRVLEAMKSDRELREIPVIMVSGVDDLEPVARCIELGADDYLPKPPDPILLEARVNASLSKERLRQRDAEYRHAVGHVAEAAAALRRDTFKPETLEPAAQRHDPLGQLARALQDVASEVAELRRAFKAIGSPDATAPVDQSGPPRIVS